MGDRYRWDPSRLGWVQGQDRRSQTPVEGLPKPLPHHCFPFPSSSLLPSLPSLWSLINFQALGLHRSPGTES